MSVQRCCFRTFSFVARLCEKSIAKFVYCGGGTPLRLGLPMLEQFRRADIVDPAASNDRAS